MRRAIALLLLAVMSGCASTVPSPGQVEHSATPEMSMGETPSSVQPTPTPTPDTATWPLVWSDEFDGPSGALPDAASWGYELGDGTAVGLAGWGNQEREFYTESPDNVALDGAGNLAITVRRAQDSEACYYGPCQYTSARLLTRGLREFQYGRIEVRFKMPDGFGLWPAIWLLGADTERVGWPNGGEIDLIEFLGRRPNEILGTIHGPGYSGSGGLSRTLEVGEPVSGAFHTAAIEWWPGYIAWFFDGSKYHEAGPDDVAPNAWVFDHPFYLLMNVAVGGNLGGPVDPQMELPQSMLIDYVRLYRGDLP